MKVRYRRSSRHAVRGPDRGGSALFQGRWNRALRLLLRKLNAHSRSANSLSASQLSTEGALQRTVSKPGVGRADVAFKLTEAKMIIPKYTLDDFKKLPLRAIVAFGARCARRVESLAIPPDNHPAHESCRSAVTDAIEFAEDFARGSPCTACESVIPAIEASREATRGELVRENAIAAVLQAAYTAAAALHAVALRAEPEERHMLAPPTRSFAHLADLSAELAALDAFTAAVEASDATGYPDDFISGAVGDYEKLLSLNLGSYPRAGRPIDPSPRGPLGPLWPGQPQSFGQAVTSP